MTATSPTAAMDEPSNPLSDAELVDRFVSVCDPAAIAELVERHSRLVLGVCRRVLRDAYDIEDVFQATFLVLVRDAARVRKQQSIASWLYGVAYRLALRVARQKQRRRETMLVDGVFRESDTLDELASRHDQQLVDAELNTLPERYRLPMVLRYLVGKSPREIATELNISLDALDGLLKRGKDQLRMRLMRRGVSLGVAMAALQFSQQAAQAAHASPLIDSTIEAGLAWQGGSNMSPDLISDRALELSGKELATMTTLTKTSLVLGMASGLFALGIGASTFVGDPDADRAEAGVVSALRSTLSTTVSVEPAVFGQDPALPTPIVLAAAPPETIPAEAPPATPPMPAKIAKPWDRKPRNANVAKIESALQMPTEVSFSDNPLEETLNYLQDLHHIEVMLDRGGLQEAGVTKDQQITLQISGVSLKSVLEMMLEPLALDYVIKNEVIMITTQAKADSTREVRVYDISRLNGITASELDDIIRSTVAPETWSMDRQKAATATTVGMGSAPGAIRVSEKVPVEVSKVIAKAASGTETTAASTEFAAGGTSRYTANSLIIRQSQRVHEEIVDLLNQLERSKDNRAEPAINRPVTKDDFSR